MSQQPMFLVTDEFAGQREAIVMASVGDVSGLRV
jgi:hypothetical protein